MNGLSIYQYQSAIEFLRDSIAEKKRNDPAFSIRKFSKSIDFGSHAYLVMILRGRRVLTLNQVAPLAHGLGLNSEERIYFQTLLQLDRAKTEEEKNLVRLWLNDLNPRREYRILDVEHYHLIADWVHMTILTLAKIEGAKMTAENVHELIQKKVPLPKVREAMNRLIELELLKQTENGLRPTQDSVRTRDDISSRGAREYHRQVSKLAVDALEEQDPSVREFQAFAVTVPEGKIPLAKDLIRKFRHQLVQILESEPGHEVYQCNLQFFKLAESPSTLSNTRESKVNEAKLDPGERPISIPTPSLMENS